MNAALRGVLLDTYAHSPIQVEVANELKPIQNILGGIIETINCFRFELLVHQEELTKNPSPVINLRASLLVNSIRPELEAVVHGPALIVGADGSEWTSITQGMIKGYLATPGDVPTCDMCARDKAIVDIVGFHKWAYMCSVCVVLHSMQVLGTGWGQLLVPKEEWDRIPK